MRCSNCLGETVLDDTVVSTIIDDGVARKRPIVLDGVKKFKCRACQHVDFGPEATYATNEAKQKYFWSPSIPLRKKIIGMLVGGAIGDALGFPVETWSADTIRKMFPGGVQRYQSPIAHKWFSAKQMPAGSTTDDTQLTLAVMRGLIEGHEKASATNQFSRYLDAIADQHVKALENPIGWGKSTREAVQRIRDGVKWWDAGKSSIPGRGTGNGVPMKVSPIAAWHCSPAALNFAKSMCSRCVNLSKMTHNTKMSAEASIWHNTFVYIALWSEPEEFNAWEHFDGVYQLLWEGEDRMLHRWFDLTDMEDTDDQLRDNMDKLWEVRDTLSYMDLDAILSLFPGTPFYVYNSLPVTYAGILRAPLSIDTIFWLVNAGGDTDTNAKMAGELVGALHGIDYFQRVENRWACEGLKQFQELVDLGNEFCDTFQIE